jgi:spore coat protein U-like protein
MRRVTTVAMIAGLAVSGSNADAATATANLSVSMTISAQCITSAATMTFPATGVISAAVDTSTTISVQCTNGTTYNVGFDQGAGTGATVATRKMTNGAATINYSLYQDSGRATVWGNTVGTNTVAGTGNGAAQSLTVYGRVPVQTSPAVGTYADTVQLVVTY